MNRDWSASSHLGESCMREKAVQRHSNQLHGQPVGWQWLGRQEIVVYCVDYATRSLAKMSGLSRKVGMSPVEKHIEVAMSLEVEQWCGCPGTFV